MVSPLATYDAAYPQTANAVRQYNRRAEILEAMDKGLAEHRDIKVDTPPAHLRQCLSPDNRYLAQLQHQAGRGGHVRFVQLTTEELHLPRPAATQALPSQQDPLRWVKEPPMGLRAAVTFPQLRTQYQFKDVPPGARLLACSFETLQFMRASNVDLPLPPLRGVVVAYPPDPGRDGQWHVWWLRPQVFESGQTKYIAPGLLARLRAPAALIDSDGSGLVLTSMAHDGTSLGGWRQRVLDGIFVFNAVSGAQAGDPARWQLAQPATLVPEHSTCAGVVFSPQGRYVAVSGADGVSLFDARRPGPIVALLPIPQELAGCEDAHARHVAFAAQKPFVVANFTGQKPCARAGGGRSFAAQIWGHVYPWDELSLSPSAPQALVHRHVPTMAQAPGAAGQASPVWRSVDWVGPGDDVVLAYADALYRCQADAGAQALIPQASTGASKLKTHRRSALVRGLGLHDLFVVVDRDSLRLYPNPADVNSRLWGSRHTLPLRESRSQHLAVLEAQGVTPSANQLASAPFLSRDGRFLFAAFDGGQVLHRWDFGPQFGERARYVEDPEPITRVLAPALYRGMPR